MSSAMDLDFKMQVCRRDPRRHTTSPSIVQSTVAGIVLFLLVCAVLDMVPAVRRLSPLSVRTARCAFNSSEDALQQERHDCVAVPREIIATAGGIPSYAFAAPMPHQFADPFASVGDNNVSPFTGHYDGEPAREATPALLHDAPHLSVMGPRGTGEDGVVRHLRGSPEGEGGVNADALPQVRTSAEQQGPLGREGKGRLVGTQPLGGHPSDRFTKRMASDRVRTDPNSSIHTHVTVLNFNNITNASVTVNFDDTERQGRARGRKGMRAQAAINTLYYLSDDVPYGPYRDRYTYTMPDQTWLLDTQATFYSGMSLMMSGVPRAYKIGSTRFLVTAQQRTNVIRYVTQPPSNSQLSTLYFTIGVSVTTSALKASDPISVAGQPLSADRWRSANSANTYVNLPTALSQNGCGGLMNYQLYLAEGVGFYHDYALRVKFPDSALTPTCSNKNILASVTLYSSHFAASNAMRNVRYSFLVDWTNAGIYYYSEIDTYFATRVYTGAASDVFHRINNPQSDWFYRYGDPENPTVLYVSGVTSRLMSHMSPASDRFWTEREGHMQINQALSSEGVACRVGATNGYDAYDYGRTGLLSGSMAYFDGRFVGVGRPILCYTFDTVDDLHYACEQRADCKGFSTVRVSTRRDSSSNGYIHKELPLCLYIRGTLNGAYDYYAFDRRLYYRKPAHAERPVCKFVVETSGTFAISIQQTYLKTSSVTVKVNGELAVECGNAKRFIQSIIGQDGRDSSYYVCHVAHLAVGSRIEVQSTNVNGGLQHSNCENTLGVLMEPIRFDSNTSQVYLPNFAPADTKAALAGMQTLPVQSSDLSGRQAFVKRVFVYNVTEAALTVDQTGYDCGLYEARHPGLTCPNHTVTFSSRMSCQVCGGQKGFDGHSGLSGRCQIQRMCGAKMSFGGQASSLAEGASSCQINNERPSAIAVPYTGLLTIAVPPLSLAYDGDYCNYFSASISANNYGSNPLNPVAVGMRVPVFPLMATANVSNPARSVFLCISPGDHLSEMLTVPLATVQQHISSEPVLSIGSDADGSLSHLYYFNQAASLQSYFGPNSSFACVVDQMADVGATCRFSIPKGATRLRVSVAQTYFASGEVSVAWAGTSTTAAERTVCGNGRRFGFMDGIDERCDLFYDCINAFMYQDVSSAVATSGYVLVTIPSTVNPSTCDLSAAVKVTFDQELPLVTACDAGYFMCMREGRCIPTSDRCNGVQDCFHNTDETEVCIARVAIPDERFCPEHRVGFSSIAFENYTDKIYSREDCMRAAGTHFGLTHNSATGACTVYTGTSVSYLSVGFSWAFWSCPILDAEGRLGNGTGETFLALTEAERPEFDLCHPNVQCNGHGRAYRPTGSTVCECECYAGYTGADCASVYRIDIITGLFVSAIVHNDTDAVDIAALEVALRLGSGGIIAECDHANLTSVPEPDAATDATEQHYVNDGRLIGIDCVVRARGEVSSSQIDVHYRNLLQTDSKSSLNTALSLTSSSPLTVMAIAFRTPATEFVSAATDCDVTYEGTLLMSHARCVTKQSVDRARFTFHSNGAVKYAHITITEDGGPNARPMVTTLSCSMHSPVVVQDPYWLIAMYNSEEIRCHTSNCDFNLAVGAGAVIDFNITSVESEGTADRCLTERVYVGGYRRRSNVTDVGATDLATFVHVDHGGFLNGGISLFVCGCCACWVVGILLLVVHYAQRRRARRLAVAGASLSLSPAQEAKTVMLANLAFDRRQQEKGILRRKDLWGVFITMSGLYLGLVASFLLIYWATAVGRSSNLHVLYEEYSDSHCEASLVSMVPSRMLAIPDGEYSCARTESFGESAGMTYAAAECHGDSGEYVVKVRLGTSLDTCSDSFDTVLPSGSCVDLRQLLPTSTRAAYLRFTCAPAALIADHIGAFRRATEPPEDTASLLVVLPSPSEDLSQAAVAPSGGGSGPVFRYTMGFLGNGVSQTSSSHEPGVLASQASPADFNNDRNPLRIVLQPPQCLSQEAAASCQTPIENLLAAKMAHLSASVSLEGGDDDHHDGLLRAYAPRLPDSPIGYIYNGYGTSTYMTWKAGGKQAHRYYNASGTSFDMGQHFPADDRNLDNDEGYSISLYMRADRTTQGFAFAVCDAFENVFKGTIYPLDRLGEIIAAGKGGSHWYSDTYSVYQSLYVNGPGHSLIFAYAGPTLKDRVVLLEYDLARIGMLRLLNGMWHHVSISFIVENGKARAQLSVDGESSYTKPGWSVCVDEFPAPITQFERYERLRAHNYTDRTVKGGVVVTGYFNGGVYNLRATPKPLLSSDFLATGTRAMQDNSPFPRRDTLILGTVLLVLCAALLVVLFAGQVRSSSSSNSSSNSGGGGEGAMDAARTYYDLMDAAVRSVASTPQASASQLFGKSFSKSKATLKMATTSIKLRGKGQRATFAKPILLPAPHDSVDLAPLRFTTALRWLDLPPAGLATVMEEVVRQTIPAEMGCEALVLMLYRAGLGQRKGAEMLGLDGAVGGGITSVTVDAWNALVEADAKAQHEKEKRLCGFGEKRSDAAEEERLLGSDVFSALFEAPADGGAMEKVESVVIAVPDLANFDDALRSADALEMQPTAAFGVGLGDDSEGDSSSWGKRRNDQNTTSQANNALQAKQQKDAQGGATSALAGAGGMGAQSIQQGFPKEAGMAGRGVTNAGTNTTTTAVNVPKTTATGTSNVKPLPTTTTDEAAGAQLRGDGLHIIGGRVDFKLPALGIFENASVISASLLSVFQTMFVWSTSISLPKWYNDQFEALFAFVSIDFANVFDDISTLVTPLLQLFAALAAVGAIFYCLYLDSSAFERNLAQYVWRRDALEVDDSEVDDDGTDTADRDGTYSPASTDGPRDAVQKQAAPPAPSPSELLASLPAELQSALDDPCVPEPPLHVELLPINASREMDLFAGIRKPKQTKGSAAGSNGKAGSPAADTNDSAAGSATQMTAAEANGCAVGDQKDFTDSPATNRNVRFATTDQTARVVTDTAAPLDGGGGITSSNSLLPQGTEFEGAGAAEKAQTDYSALTSITVESIHGEQLLVTRVGDAEEQGGKSTQLIASLQFTDDELHDYGAEKPAGDAESSPPPIASLTAVAPVETLGICCQRHKGTYLSAQVQTTIWPFANAPRCCAIVNGQLCDAAVGKIYSCGLEEKDAAEAYSIGEDGAGMLGAHRRRVCTYALCEAHCRRRPFEEVLLLIVGLKRRLQNSGFSWLAGVVVMMLANVAYTPFMKTALMILGCHPFYQCEFQHCWDDMDQKFAIAVFCCITVVVLLGVGFPGLLFYSLWSRNRSMRAAFVGPEYKGRYASAANSKAISEGEWVRFIATDNTALGQQYQTLYYHWMYFPAIAILLKVIKLLPAIFIEPRSFDQRLGCGVIQVFITLFLFVNKTHLSPMVLVTLRAAEVHNLAILGLQNIALITLNDSQSEYEVSIALVATTCLYIAFSAGTFVYVVALPIIQSMRLKARLTAVLETNGFDYSQNTTLYQNPFQPVVAAGDGDGDVGVDEEEEAQNPAALASRFDGAEELAEVVLGEQVDNNPATNPLAIGGVDLPRPHGAEELLAPPQPPLVMGCGQEGDLTPAENPLSCVPSTRGGGGGGDAIAERATGGNAVEGRDAPSKNVFEFPHVL